MQIASSYFTTEAYPGNHRATAWLTMLAQFSLQPKRIEANSSLHASAHWIVSPLGISFARLNSSVQELRTHAEGAEDGIWLALHLEGRARLRTPDSELTLSPGDIAYGPLRADFSMCFDSDFQQFFVKIPRAILDSRLMSLSTLRVGIIQGRSGFGHVFAGMLGSIADTIDKFDADQFQPVEIALTEFLATCLVSEVSTKTLRGATATQMAILNRICQQIEARLGEHELSRDSLAEAEGISPRYVQKLFENAGENFAHYLRLRRLERCRSELVNPLYAHLSITDICFRWGFNDSAHFSRVFREQYGTSPRTYRKTVGAAVESSMMLHIGRGRPQTVDEAKRRLAGPAQEKRFAALDKPYAAKLKSVPAPALLPPKVDPSSTADLAGPKHHYIPANDKTVHWGFLSRSLEPILTINSGDAVTIETLTHHANDDFERMVKGDSGAESVFRWTKEGKNIERRGAGPMDASIYGRGPGEGFGVHLCTGPIAIAGAEPGDVIELRILKVSPRPSANPRYSGRAFGSNAATWWGFQYKDLLTEPKPREVVTVYEVDCSSSHARAAYSFRWTPQLDPSGVLHPTIDYPGIPVDHSTVVENHNFLKGVKIPLRPHFGFIALAPKEEGLVDSIPPSYFGGNLDNWRAGQGATIYLPVSVPGALLSIGDPHASQGDSELCGTAIECSLTGMFQVILHKKRDLAAQPYADLTYPLLETEKEWVVHGFSFANYLAELGDSAQSEIYKRSSLDPAMRDAFWKMRRFLMTSKGLSEDEAISLMSVAVDFGVTQIVDGNWCVHALLRKSLFECDDASSPRDCGC
jgi:acetamidase/formamidase/AraC-like DNA-binding protein